MVPPGSCLSGVECQWWSQVSSWNARCFLSVVPIIVRHRSCKHFTFSLNAILLCGKHENKIVTSNFYFPISLTFLALYLLLTVMVSPSYFASYCTHDWEALSLFSPCFILISLLNPEPCGSNRPRARVIIWSTSEPRTCQTFVFTYNSIWVESWAAKGIRIHLWSAC